MCPITLTTCRALLIIAVIGIVADTGPSVSSRGAATKPLFAQLPYSGLLLRILDPHWIGTCPGNTAASTMLTIIPLLSPPSS